MTIPKIQKTADYQIFKHVSFKKRRVNVKVCKVSRGTPTNYENHIVELE